MIAYLSKLILTCLPQNAISRLVGKAARSRISKYFIKPYISAFKLDTSEMENPLKSYPNLAAFFTRKLKSGARPICSSPSSIASPVDGTVAQLGIIKQGTLIQAKNIHYTVEQLLGCSKEKAALYDGGTFITIYLSPRDYHRIHMPIDGECNQYTYIPGRLFPVNTIGVNHVPGLFTKNERMITYANTQAGEVAIVKVGAFIVGSVKIAYSEHTTNQKQGKYVSVGIDPPACYKKGQEIGLFEFGSTVILLFEKGRMEYLPGIQEGKYLRVGEQIGTYLVQPVKKS
ncbi:archaetidylserine decarboxylase [Aneurinibacillus terranovensis]|uniref:archaetidylserine decarboxylase n=1 Tax=Aneurinibacillus terranovensis TaxID=278991 RepID=UPI00041CB223|nr:archaetidylserine decarboxylase [Aneurinibacillus terranovensis]